jgi:hypothetical protein
VASDSIGETVTIYFSRGTSFDQEAAVGIGGGPRDLGQQCGADELEPDARKGPPLAVDESALD